MPITPDRDRAKLIASDAARIRAYSPTLADQISVRSSAGLEQLGDELLRAMRRNQT